MTEAPGDAERLARDWSAGHPDPIIVVVGGDGSIHEVMNGIMAAGGSARLGIIPAGTGNDVCRNLGLPLHAEAAARALDPETPRPIDLVHGAGDPGSVGTWSRWFINSVSLGVSAKANRIAPRVGRFLPGSTRYPVAGALALANGRPIEYEIRVGGRSLLAGSALNLTVANGAGFGGGLQISPPSRPDDGALEVVVIGAMSRIAALGALARLRTGRHLGLDRVRMLEHLKEPFEIGIDRTGTAAEGDGENFTVHRTLSIELQPGRLSLI